MARICSNKTDVARFVHRIDKLEMILQARQYAKEGYSHKLLAQVFQFCCRASIN